MSKLVANEHFCMTLAAQLGMVAADVSIVRLPSPVLLIKRFDRFAEAAGVRRLHIIDGCQALDLPVSHKYERNFGSGRDVREIREGVSFARLFSATGYAVEKAVTRLSLIRWALLQYLIGNADAHGKNVSFFCRPAGLALAPFYDLVSVVQYPDISHDLAMAFGDEFSLENIRPYDWAKFASATSTPRSLLAREMRRLAKAAPPVAAKLSTSNVYVEDEKPLVRQIARFVEAQSTRLSEMAAPMLAVDAASL